MYNPIHIHLVHTTRLNDTVPSHIDRRKVALMYDMLSDPDAVLRDEMSSLVDIHNVTMEYLPETILN